MLANRVVSLSAASFGVLLLLFWLFFWWNEFLDTPLEGFLQLVLLPFPLLAFVTLLGIYRRESAGRLGSIGLLVALVGTVVIALLAAGRPFLQVSPVATPAAWMTSWVSFLTLPTIFVGWLLFSVDAVREKPLPRWNMLPLVVSIVVLVVTLLHDVFGLDEGVVSAGVLLIGVGWILLGCALWSPWHGLPGRA